MVLSRGMGLGSSRPNAGHVKPESWVGRLFEGWQVGLVVIVTAALAVLIAVPRPALPDEIPFPSVDRRALAAISLRDERRAQEASQERLPFDVRSLGETVRSYGLADAEGNRETVSRRLGEIQTRLGPARREGDDALLRLRAVQMQIFLREIERFESTGTESDELREVGGGLVAMVRRSGWVRVDAGASRLVADRYVREVLFRKRWNEITGLTVPPFQPSLPEERAFYAFLFSHPVVSLPAVHEQNPAARCRAANEYLLRKVTELGRIDPHYPADYARGVLLLRLNRPREALRPLADFVERHDDGPHVLRARNALRAAQELVVETEQ